ncbi:hypothetical protein Pflav_042180 [Phytohabitans flavus]|uniref:SGNH hydrolase-type esterase domain-containing protein n=1 Tax=Phytohabitans flavus TaxID=1076124 RepID=A0A6F8XVP1_9ACTN|nr:GDSL-type esterase/lipase family protein [Phytohabitans flavus]BCB77808.1 hypothetical protein Pflav_042180 [Phytohabitans flavus]
MRNARKWWWAGLAMTAALTSSVLVAPGGTATASEGSGPRTIIQLGDSYSSGEGGGWQGNSENSGGNRDGTDQARTQTSSGWVFNPDRVYEPGTWANECHRSKTAPITSVRQNAGNVDKMISVACSGAKSQNIWPAAAGGVAQHPGVAPQLTQLDSLISSADDVELVVIGIGGNDSGFGGVALRCLIDWAKTHGPLPYDAQHCKDEVAATAGDDISDAYYNTAKTIDQVRQTLSANGQPASTYRIVLTGYPAILPTALDDWIAGEGAGFDRNCPVRKADSQWINQHFVTRLNDVTRSIAEDKGVGFIDLRDAFGGHRLCEAGTVRGRRPPATRPAPSGSASWTCTPRAPGTRSRHSSTTGPRCPMWTTSATPSARTPNRCTRTTTARRRSASA